MESEEEKPEGKKKKKVKKDLNRKKNEQTFSNIQRRKTHAKSAKKIRPKVKRTARGR